MALLSINLEIFSVIQALNVFSSQICTAPTNPLKTQGIWFATSVYEMPTLSTVVGRFVPGKYIEGDFICVYVYTCF